MSDRILHPSTDDDRPENEAGLLSVVCRVSVHGAPLNAITPVAVSNGPRLGFVSEDADGASKALERVEPVDDPHVVGRDIHASTIHELIGMGPLALAEQQEDVA